MQVLICAVTGQLSKTRGKLCLSKDFGIIVAQDESEMPVALLLNLNFHSADSEGFFYCGLLLKSASCSLRARVHFDLSYYMSGSQPSKIHLGNLQNKWNCL